MGSAPALSLEFMQTDTSFQASGGFSATEREASVVLWRASEDKSLGFSGGGLFICAVRL